MLERFVTAASVIGPISTLSPEDRKAFRAGMPPGSARRLTDGALVIAETTREANFSPDDDLIFASSLGGTLSLEAYLASFPTPSPASFQSSVHAGLLESVLVARKQPLRRLHSLANPPETLVPSALRAALVSDADVVHLLFAEERGDWLYSEGLAPSATFACYLCLSLDSTDSLGTLSLARDTAAESDPCSAESFCQIVARRESFVVKGDGMGRLSLRWQ